jgi:PiT family inorganic phosphate transporter
VVEPLLVGGVIVAAFVGFNIGGSSTGVAFGPAVGSGSLSKLLAAGLMTFFALLGGATVGTEVIQTMGGRIVPSDMFTLAASVTILFFVGLSLLISNLFGVPASTSMTAVGAIAGLGVATGTIDWATMGEIVTWWLFAPIIAFWVCAMIGRYLYPHLAARFTLESPGEETDLRERIGMVLVVVIACYMAFSAGASNVANAVGPLYGGRVFGEAFLPYVLLGAGAIGLGAFTIARRTLDTVGNDLTDLPILAALIVEVVSASIITFLSVIGIPASLAVSATMCIVGLGWGRATRTTRLADAASDAISGETASKSDDPDRTGMSMDALAADSGATVADPDASARDDVPSIGESDPDVLRAGDLFDPAATGRVVMLWILTPSLSAMASYLVFQFLPVL